jgi:hypothetical protein
MLEESVEVMRKLWTGTQVDHHGEHYVVENARLYSVPEEPPPVLVSAFGPKSIRVAARIADGYLGVKPVRELLERYDREGGKGPKVGGMKVCWAADESTGRKTAPRAVAQRGPAGPARPRAAGAGPLRAGPGRLHGVLPPRAGPRLGL